MAALFYDAMKVASRMEALRDGSLLAAFQATEKPELISFSAGFPSTETYPIERIEQSLTRVMRTYGREAMSYGTTSGSLALRTILQERLSRKFGLCYDPEEIIVTSGSQQGLDMSAMLFLDPGDVVLFEAPTYLGAVNALRIYQANLVAVPSDEEGISLPALSRKLEEYGDRVKLLYVSPDYQNPTGKSWTADRREQFMQLLADYGIPVLEDAAYSELSFEKEMLKPLAYYDSFGQVIYLGTFSKIFCPGLRVAWLCGKSKIIEKYLLLKNTADLSSCTLAQYLMADYLEQNDIEKHIENIASLYRHRCDVMVAQIRESFPKEVGFTVPKGGLYLWLELPETIDSEELLRLALQENVAFIGGAAFYPNREKKNEIRLNYSNMQDSDTRKGIKILGRVIAQML